MHTHSLQAEDEFLVVACDGLWDVLSSQRCVELARVHLRENNSPQLCAQHLVRPALLREREGEEEHWSEKKGEEEDIRRGSECAAFQEEKEKSLDPGC